MTAEVVVGSYEN